jgi:hypothetical protein
MFAMNSSCAANVKASITVILQIFLEPETSNPRFPSTPLDSEKFNSFSQGRNLSVTEPQQYKVMKVADNLWITNWKVSQFVRSELCL